MGDALRLAALLMQRPACHLMPSILSIPLTRSSPAEAGRACAEFGNRLFDNETDAFLATVGVKGDKLFDGTWGYDAGFRYSKIKNTQTGTQVSIFALQSHPEPGGPNLRSYFARIHRNDHAFNPFGDFRIPIPANSATVAFATVHPKDIDVSKLATLDATIYTTSLFKLPAGGVGFAFGGQFRRESIDEEPDALNVGGRCRR